MTRTIRIVTGLLVAAVAATAVAVAPAATSLSPGERTTLLAMRQEEKVAHDVYVALASHTGLQVFTRIASSEARHAQAVERALAAYGIADPTDGYAVGVFPTTQLQQLYDSLVARGSASIGAALQVGVEIERLDIADLQQAIRETDEPMLDLVYGNLLSGSTRHLQAFSSHLGGGLPVATPASNGQGR